jgi:hypothetical protein
MRTGSASLQLMWYAFAPSVLNLFSRTGVPHFAQMKQSGCHVLPNAVVVIPSCISWQQPWQTSSNVSTADVIVVLRGDIAVWDDG